VPDRPLTAAGFVQVPSRQGELVFGWAYHPWLVDRDGDGLVFRPRRGAGASAGEFMHAEFQASPLLRLAWTARRSRWQHSVHWRGQLALRVEGDSEAERTALLDVEETCRTLRATAVPPMPAAVQAALRCPRCHSPLAADGDVLTCRGCGAYPVAGEVPVLVEEAI
jgi:hypothetical protein